MTSVFDLSPAEKLQLVEDLRDVAILRTPQMYALAHENYRRRVGVPLSLCGFLRVHRRCTDGLLYMSHLPPRLTPLVQ